MAKAPGLNNPDYSRAKSVYDFNVYNIKGEVVKLDVYQGNVLIIVNVASNSGLTDFNYKLLNELHEAYAENKGLRILAFPCNQFNGEEPGSNEEIEAFAKERNVKFDLFAKLEVNGDDAHPLWKYLKSKASSDKGGVVRDSFTKFIVNKKGEPIDRLAPDAIKEIVVAALEAYL